MPKETIFEHRFYKNKDPRIEIRWGSDHYGIPAIIIDRGSAFAFKNDDSGATYTGLCICFESEQQMDRLIKALKRAKRKTEFLN